MQAEMKVFSGSAHPELAEAICGKLGLPLGQSRVDRFSNENMLIQIEESVREADVFVIQPSCTPVSDGILELLMLIDALKHASAARITAVTPYFPYVRSDKKDQPRISITARLMADLLETAGADRVLTTDLHAPQTQGFFRVPADQLIAAPMICEYLRTHRNLEDYILVAGDAGEAKELGAYANRLNLPMAIVDKRRYGNDEKPKAVNLIGDVTGKTALIIDDEIASGGTMVEAANFLLERGANKVEACAVHPILSGQAPERIEASPIESLIVTDTVPVSEEKRIDKLEILSVAPMFAQAIEAIHSGQSVSRLFR
jgi:ribose-phosphate pyrophosphokinase